MTATTHKPFTLKRWVLFTCYGWFTGILLVVVLAIISESIFTTSEEYEGQAVVGIGMGAGVGLMQWMAVRHYLNDAHKFFWSTFSGLSIAFILMDVASVIIARMTTDLQIKTETAIPLIVLLGAFIAGWLQYKFIFGKMMKKAGLWVLHSVSGWVAATILTMSVTMLNLKLGEHFPKAMVGILALLFLSIGGPVLGYVTGRFITQVIKNPGTETK